jgi:DNA transformation protein
LKTAEKLSKLKNIGEISEKMLNSIDVFTKEDIEDLGPVTIYFILKSRGFDVSMNMVYALQGAIMDLRWNELPNDVKNNLIEQVETSGF